MGAIALLLGTLGTTLYNRYQGQDFDLLWDAADSDTSGYFGRFILAARP